MWERKMPAMEKGVLLLFLIATIYDGTLFVEPCKDIQLKVKYTTKTSISLEWICNATDENPITGFKLFYYRYDEGDKQVDLPNSTNSYTLEDMLCGAEHTVRIQAYDMIDEEKQRTISEDSISVLLRDSESEDVIYPTNEEFLEVGATSVTLKLDHWQTGCPAEAFYVHLDDGRREVHVDGAEKRFVIKDLKPDHHYRMDVREQKYRRGGRAEYAFKTFCPQKAPQLPTGNFLYERENSLAVDLQKFPCVDTYSIEYRQEKETEWTLASNDIKFEQKSFLIQQLSHRTSYKLRITARCAYGETVGEYDFQVKPTSNDCGKWIDYKGKCIKFMKDAGLLLKNESQVVCQQMQEDADVPLVLTIGSKAELESLYESATENSVPGDIWSGLQSEDGYELTDLSTDGIDSRCGQMVDSGHRKSYRVVLQWQRSNCTARTYPVCEKPYPIPLRNLYFDLEKRLEAEGVIQKIKH